MMTGSISEGTLKTDDLISAFFSILPIEKQDSLLAQYPELSDEEMSDDDSAYLLDMLHDELCDMTPEGFYFGAHIGDGACFGFWANEE